MNDYQVAVIENEKNESVFIIIIIIREVDIKSAVGRIKRTLPTTEYTNNNAKTVTITSSDTNEETVVLKKGTDF